MSPSLPQILIVVLIIVLLFGANRIPRLMGDLGKGINAFKKGVKETEDETVEALEDSSDDNVAESSKSKSKSS